jgi:hypothetical protein
MIIFSCSPTAPEGVTSWAALTNSPPSAYRPAADEDVHAVRPRQLRVQRDTPAGELGDLGQCRLKVAGDGGPEGGGLLDRGVFGEHEEVGAGGGAARHPAADLVLPRRERGGRVDRVLRSGHFQYFARGHLGLPWDRAGPEAT